MFKRFLNFIRGVWHRVIPYRQIEAVERIETPLTDDMVNALDDWYKLYRNEPDWLGEDGDIKSLNLPAFIASELARQVTLLTPLLACWRRSLPSCKPCPVRLSTTTSKTASF